MWGHEIAYPFPNYIDAIEITYPFPNYIDATIEVWKMEMDNWFHTTVYWACD